MRNLLIFLLLTTFASKCDPIAAETVELTARDYGMLSDFLQGQQIEDSIRVGPLESVIDPIAGAWMKPLTGSQREEVTKELKGLQADTLNSFADCAVERRAVRHSFNLKVKYQIARPWEIKDLKAFDDRYPRANGYVHFSCIGINPSSTQALFHVERAMTSNLLSKWVLMEVNSSGHWIVTQEYVTLIS